MPVEETIKFIFSSLPRFIYQPRVVKTILLSPAALCVLALGLRWLYPKACTTHITGDPGKVRRRLKDRDIDTEYDIVIVGGGTAGCVLASRLSEDPSIRVLLLEAGTSSRTTLCSQIPALFPRSFHTALDYNLYTVPQTHAASKRKYWPRGKMLGGCSSVNAMMFHHGAPSDYDEWAQLQKGQEGAEEWSYQQLHRYFMKFETYNPSKEHDLVDVRLRGSSGPVHVGHFGHVSELTHKFIRACHNAGVCYNPDINTSKGTLGSTETPTYIDARRRRVTTETAYLTPAVLARKNLTVATKAKVLRILFEHKGNAGNTVPHAVAVQYANERGKVFEVKARREVVLAAGAIHTPQILMLSGVGPANHLVSHGIPVVADLPGVGSHLMDHGIVSFYFMDRSKADISALTVSDIRGIPRPSLAFKLARAALQYYMSGTGPFAGNIAEAMSFARSDDPKLFPHDVSRNAGRAQLEDTTSGANAPDIEVLFTPLAYMEHGDVPFPIKGHHFGLNAILLRPTSMGTLRLHSADAYDAPVIDPKYLSTRHDVDVFVRAARLVSRIAQREPLASLVDPAGDDIPLLNHKMDRQSDAEIEALVRDRVQTLYHPTSTARMAPRADGGVVDPFLRVHGVPNLRVVDASMFPTIPSGHTSAPVIAVAEKAADMIKETLIGHHLSSGGR